MTQRISHQLPTLRDPSLVMRWATDLLRRLNDMARTVEQFFPGGRHSVVKPRVVTVAEIPDPSGLDRLLVLSTGKLIYSDGIVWRYAATDGAV